MDSSQDLLRFSYIWNSDAVWITFNGAELGACHFEEHQSLPIQMYPFAHFLWIATKT